MLLCTSDDACASTSQVCDDGTCRDPRENEPCIVNLSTCPPSTACNADLRRCIASGKQLGANSGCKSNADCDSTKYCAGGLCNNRLGANAPEKCSSDGDCEDSAACYEGVCKRLCDKSSPTCHAGDVCRQRVDKTLGVCLLQASIEGEPSEGVPKEDVPDPAKKSDKATDPLPAATTKPSAASAPGFFQRHLPAWIQRSHTRNELFIGGAALLLVIVVLVLLVSCLFCRSRKRRPSGDAEVPRVVSQASRRL